MFAAIILICGLPEGPSVYNSCIMVPGPTPYENQDACLDSLSEGYKTTLRALAELDVKDAEIYADCHQLSPSGTVS